MEIAAIGGHPEARHNLVLLEFKNGRYDKVMKHEIIAANLGDDYALERVKDLYFTGGISKEAYAAALRGHQAAVNATKTPQREKMAKYF